MLGRTDDRGAVAANARLTPRTGTIAPPAGRAHARVFAR
jgi:hypothetical protein